MSYAVLVQELDCLQQLLYYISNRGLMFDASSTCDPLSNILHQSASRDQLYYKEVLPLIFIDFDDFHYIRVSSDLLKMFHCFYFSRKQLFELLADFTLVLYRLFADDLGGARHLCHLVDREIDRPVGPYSKGLTQPIVIVIVALTLIRVAILTIILTTFIIKFFSIIQRILPQNRLLLT